MRAIGIRALFSTRGTNLVAPSTFIMAAILIALGFYLLYPVLLLLIYTFNVAPEVFVPPRQWGLGNWSAAFQQPRIAIALWNSFMVWGLTVIISLPVAVTISWLLARVKIPFSHGLEFMFWISYMMPGLATTIGWISLMDPDIGLLNIALRWLPFVDQGPFNIFSVGGIVWAHVMANGISLKVMLLTPAFRNMDASLEEAAQISGASNIRTMIRITLPLMIAPITLVFALQLLRVFQSFETEYLLGTPINFFVYSTLIFDMIRKEPPLYGQATVLASLTLIVLVFLIPMQRWILERRRYTTITAGFRPGLVDLGRWRNVATGSIWTIIVLLTGLPVAALVFGSFMVRSGFFDFTPTYTTFHWEFVLTDRFFTNALLTTLPLATIAAILSPILFSVLAYILVRTRWRGRAVLDIIIWGSGAIPGMLSGLGLLLLFLGTPVLVFLYGTIWALLLVVIIQGNTTGTNVMKGVFVQVGQDMEDAARVAGAGWVRTYVTIWIPLMMRTLVLLATMNFVMAAGATSSIILLASRDTMTLSILALEYRLGRGDQEAASIVAIFLMGMTVAISSLVWALGARLGVRHTQTSALAAPGGDRQEGAARSPGPRVLRGGPT